MRKILLFLFAFYTLMGAVKAQEDATISPDEIQYWIGEGENEAILIVQWCDPEIAFAWGYRFDGEVNVQTMLDEITAEDSRLTYEGDASTVNQIYYNDDDYSLALVGWYWMYNMNGWMAGLGYTSQMITDGDVVKWGDVECATEVGDMSDWENFTYIWTTEVTPVSNPNGTEVVDATISADEIEFWVGEGENEVVVIISWCEETETALAWGYRFNGETNLFAALTDIAAADDRLTVVGSAPSDILYEDDEYSLNMTGDYPMHGINGAIGQTGMSGQAIVDGDIAKIGGYDCAIIEGGWTDGTISWTTPVIPATEPEDEMVDATISADEIEYWIGEGENETILIVQWCDPEIAFAWGYRFDGEATVETMMDAIVAEDSRLTYEGSYGIMNQIYYNDDDYNLTLVGDYWMYNLNGWMAGLGYTEQTINDGDVVKWGDPACAIALGDPMDWENFTYIWTTEVTPVSNPNTPEEVVDATISADEVEYWLGEGENQVVVAISWCSNTQAALAWGYRFHGDATVFDALTAIAAADSRLAVVGTAPTNITYQDGTLDLTMCPNPSAQWTDPDYDVPMHSVNGLVGLNYMNAEPIHDNDFVHIGGYACGIYSDDWTAISWTTPIQPATAPTEVGPSDETFDGVAGTEGCQGIHCEDPAILGWATTCTIERGRQNITTPGVFASYGTENDGIGAATESTADVVSLGDYGIAVLTFDIPIQNGDGYDFAVFENSLNDSFLEMAFVEVSSDGVNYFRFPAISNSDTTVQVDNGGSVDATLIHNLAGKYRAGWGTPFDLEELAGNDDLDINNITHIRLVDVVGCVAPRYATRDSRGHIINDPYPTPFHSSGFDLDGVAVMNGWRPSGVEENTMVNHTLTVYPNPCHSTLTLNTEAHDVVMLFNMQGALLQRVVATDNTTTLNMQDLPAGMYIVRCGNQSAKVVKQ